MTVSTRIETADVQLHILLAVDDSWQVLTLPYVDSLEGRCSWQFDLYITQEYASVIYLAYPYFCFWSLEESGCSVVLLLGAGTSTRNSFTQSILLNRDYLTYTHVASSTSPPETHYNLRKQNLWTLIYCQKHRIHFINEKSKQIRSRGPGNFRAYTL